MRELIGRVRRAGATGPLFLRADSGFWSKKVIKACRDHGVSYSITVRQVAAVKLAIAGMDNDAWAPIDHTVVGDAEVAECPYGDGHRLVVRRTRIVGAQAELFANWRHHAFITDSTVDADAEHRAHAVIELAIRDLKDGAGLEHCPSGRFHANGAWAVLATAAHNLLRWTHLIGGRDIGPIVAKDDATQAGRPARPHHPRRTPPPTAPARTLAMAHRLPPRPPPFARHPAALLTARSASRNPPRGGRHNQARTIDADLERPDTDHDHTEQLEHRHPAPKPASTPLQHQTVDSGLKARKASGPPSSLMEGPTSGSALLAGSLPVLFVDVNNSSLVTLHLL